MQADETRAGFDRRGFLKRAAVVSGATAWATPTVQSLVAPAFALGTQPGGCTACLTGGGQILETATSKIVFMGQNIGSLSFGVGQLCCEGQGPITIEVNAHPTGRKSDDVSYHFDRNLVMTCSKVGNPAPPPATRECANKFTGTAEDKSGNVLTFSFEDFGEPGQMVDRVSILIESPGGAPILSGSGLLDRGNLQAHESLGPIKRDCSGC